MKKYIIVALFFMFLSNPAKAELQPIVQVNCMPEVGLFQIQILDIESLQLENIKKGILENYGVIIDTNNKSRNIKCHSNVSGEDIIAEINIDGSFISCAGSERASGFLKLWLSNKDKKILAYDGDLTTYCHYNSKLLRINFDSQNLEFFGVATESNGVDGYYAANFNIYQLMHGEHDKILPLNQYKLKNME